MANFITLLLAESALEVFPQELIQQKEIRDYLRKIDKKPNELILDKSYHYNFMKSLKNREKRGRPDIVHFALLSCYGSILAKEERIRVIIHTYDNKVIVINPKIRLPKNLDRFNGLFLQLLEKGQIPPDSPDPFMILTESSLEDLLINLQKNHDVVIEFSVKGKKMDSNTYTSILHNSSNPLLVFGAFPEGHLEIKNRNKLIDHTVAIYKAGLDLFSVIAQILASLHNMEEKKTDSKTAKSWHQ